MRGFACIGLDNPKNMYNIGGILRAAQNYQVSMVTMGACRISARHVADTMKTYRHIPVLRLEDVLETIPYDCVPVAIDLVEGAVPLPEYTHPERAYYIFGAEDQTLGKRILDRCRDTVYVPTYRCMNLAATVNVLLYDRAVKRNEWPTIEGEYYEQQRSSNSD